jgi:hypothetical protein
VTGRHHDVLLVGGGPEGPGFCALAFHADTVTQSSAQRKPSASPPTEPLPDRPSRLYQMVGGTCRHAARPARQASKRP